MNDSIPNIWLMQTQRDSNGLIAALHHVDPTVRRAAAVSLRIIGAREATPALRHQLETEPDPRVRVAVMAALDHLDPQIVATSAPPKRQGNKPQSRVERLIEHLLGNHPPAAIQAARALGDLGDKLAVPPLVRVFRNQRQPPAVRLAAAEALLKMDSAPAEATLLAALRNPKWQLRRNGAAILGQLQAAWAVEPLGAALRDENRQVAKTALAALRRIGTAEAIAEIEKRRRATPMRKANNASTKPLKLSTQQQQQQPAPNPEVTRGMAKKAADKLASMGDDDAPTVASQQMAPARPTPQPPTPAPPNDATADTRPTANATADDTRPASDERKPPPDPPRGWTGALKLPEERRKSRRRKSATRRLDAPDDDD